MKPLEEKGRIRRIEQRRGRAIVWVAIDRDRHHSSIP